MFPIDPPPGKIDPRSPLTTSLRRCPGIFRNVSRGRPAECLQEIFRQIGQITLAGAKRNEPGEEGINGSDWENRGKKGEEGAREKLRWIDCSNSGCRKTRRGR
jgi:hypothetical protein